MKNQIGYKIWKWAEKIFPYNRSLTGEGVVKTLNFVKSKLPKIKIKKIRSGSKVFDWKVPYVWNIKDAYIKNSRGNKIIDYKNNNLHVVGYSTSINKKLNLYELKKKLHTLKNIHEAIPYRTTYYKKDWGFCIQYEKFKKLKKDNYQVYIDSKFTKGFLNYGELLLKGKSKKEILFSTYICHPSMANNEVSGIVLLTALSKYISSLKNRYFTYRIIFIPETIGSIVYIKRNLKNLKKNVIAGFVASCVGDNNNYSYLETRNSNTLTDKLADKMFSLNKIKYKKYSFLDRGSDERQFNSPGVDLPIGSLMRTKYKEYKYYHTSLDNMKFISPKGFQGSYNIYKNIVELAEMNLKYKTNFICEPFLSNRGLKNTIGGGVPDSNFKEISNIIAYSDGKKDLIDLSNLLKIDLYKLNKLTRTLYKKGILKIID